MKIKAKVQVKEVFIAIEKENRIYSVTFLPREKEIVCNKVQGLGIDGNLNIVRFSTNILDNIKIDEELFSFISSHSREQFVIDIERHEDNEFPETRIIKVALIYG